MLKTNFKIIKEIGVTKEHLRHHNCTIGYLEGVIMQTGEFIASGSAVYINTNHKIYKEVKKIKKVE